jgi:hypothetical protein
LTTARQSQSAASANSVIGCSDTARKFFKAREFGNRAYISPLAAGLDHAVGRHRYERMSACSLQPAKRCLPMAFTGGLSRSPAATTQLATLEREIPIRWRVDLDCRNNGRWSARFDTITWASRPGSAKRCSMGCDGAGIRVRRLKFQALKQVEVCWKVGDAGQESLVSERTIYARQATCGWMYTCRGIQVVPRSLAGPPLSNVELAIPLRSFPTVSMRRWARCSADRRACRHVVIEVTP